MQKNLIIVDNNAKSLSELCQSAKKLGFDTLPFNESFRVLRALAHCHDVVAVICNLRDHQIPNQHFVKTLKSHRIPLTIFSDIPGIDYVNSHFFTGVQFFKGPANSFLLKYCLNDQLPKENPKENLALRQNILKKFLKTMPFSKVFSKSLHHKRKKIKRPKKNNDGIN